MEIKEAEQRVVIAKPVASRPNICSGFQSFSELLAGAINDSSSVPFPLLPNGCSETAVSTAIRPKTVRFNPTINRPPAGPVFSSQAEIPETEKHTLLYKPLAKLVSKSTVSLLANMGNLSQPSINDSRTQHPPLNPSLELDIQKPVVIPSEASKPTAQLANCDRPSYDAYNWRKYGQKQVKGSEYPRSYYKCTSPNCPVKRMVERSIDGQISEIVYKGEHNHSTPKSQKRNISDRTEKDGNKKVGSSSNQVSERNEGCEGRVENHNGIVGGKLSGDFRRGKGVRPYDLTATDNSCGPGGECSVRSKDIEVEDDEEPRSKRRKAENQSGEAGISGENVQSQGISVQNAIDSVILDDGYKWRKYGQKVVKGNPYPRSYYRCTSLKCNVRKHVERAADSKAYITTYEGKHNHEMPLRNSANPIMASESDQQAQTSKEEQHD